MANSIAGRRPLIYLMGCPREGSVGQGRIRTWGEEALWPWNDEAAVSALAVLGGLRPSPRA